MPPPLPAFRYHRDPVRTGVIEPASGPCPACGLASGWAYVGPFYAVADLEGICPYCIHTGLAAETLDVTYVSGEHLESDDGANVDRLVHRTPGYFSTNDDFWPAHCGDFCALLGATDWVAIVQLLPELSMDLERIQNESQLSLAELESELSRPSSPLWAYLFQCNVCGVHRLDAAYE